MLMENKRVFSIKRRHINRSQESVHIFKKPVKSNHLTRFLIESEGFECVPANYETMCHTLLKHKHVSTRRKKELLEPRLQGRDW